MLKDLKENGAIIIEWLSRKEDCSITDIEKDMGIKRCQVRAAIAYLLGKNKIKEKRVGMSKRYKLK